jgi:Asp-tRNA(Asn)/Glu-tRNA(Gln) amidotransferase A subunit family amidase
MADEAVLWASGVEQARLIRERQVSSRELTALVVDRVESVDADVAAFVTFDAERALDQARIADERLASGGPVGPFHGVPYTVKDLFDTAGVRSTYGSLLHADNVPDRDAPAVARMSEAGAVMLGKVNTPEFGLGAETVNRVARPTANPWDVTRTTGGSSGGSAAAVAAGMGSLSLGSDAGGSIRLPSAWCGVFGLKPTYGRVPTNPKRTPADHPTETAGPIARSVDDLAAMLDAIAGHHPDDPSSMRAPVASCTEAIRALDAPLRIRYGLDLGMGPADDDIDKAILTTLDHVAAAGADVEESAFDVGSPHPFLSMFDLIAGWAAAYFEYTEPRFDELMDYCQSFIEVGRKLTAADYARASYAAKVVRARLDDELTRCDVVALPVTAVVAWPHGAPPELVAGRPPGSFGGITFGGLPYLALANITGHPAVSVPCGLDGNGMPIAVQLIGRHWDEPGLLRAAAQVAAAHPLSMRPHFG